MIRFGAILALSVGLAMDAAAVSAARGMAVPRVRLRHAALVAVFFGGFQASEYHMLGYFDLIFFVPEAALLAAAGKVSKDAHDGSDSARAARVVATT